MVTNCNIIVLMSNLVTRFNYSTLVFQQIISKSMTWLNILPKMNYAGIVTIAHPRHNVALVCFVYSFLSATYISSTSWYFSVPRLCSSEMNNWYNFYCINCIQKNVNLIELNLMSLSTCVDLPQTSYWINKVQYSITQPQIVIDWLPHKT